MKIIQTGMIMLMLFTMANIVRGQIELEWEGPSDALALESASGLRNSFRNLDANGDGQDDIVTLSVEAQSEPKKMIVTSGADRSITWEYALPDNASSATRFLGFHELAGDGGHREALVAQRDGNRLIGMLEGGKVKSESGVVWFGRHYILLGAQDYDLDGGIELFLSNMNTNRVEVWGGPY